MALVFKEIEARDPPKERSGHRIISDENGFIYSFGGFNPAAVDINGVENQEVLQELMQRTLFKELWRFNPITRQWKLLKTHGQHPHQVASHSAVCYKNHLIVYGGTGYPFGHTSTNKMYSCNLSTLEWTQIIPSNPPNCPHLPTEMYGQALVADYENDCLYCVGGTTGFTYSIEVHKFDLCSRFWTQLFRKTHYDDTEFPTDRYRHEIVLYNEKIYVFGGGKANTCCTLKLLPVFDLKTNQWTKIRPTGDPGHFPCKRKCHGCVVTKDNHVYILGGITDKDICRDIWRFDLSTSTWTSIAVQMPIPLFFFGIALAPGDKMYMFGGLSKNKKQAQLRVNKLYEMWLPVPPLQELAWQAVLAYANKESDARLTRHMQVNLLKLGLPRRFSDRLRPFDEEEVLDQDVNMALIAGDPAVGNSEILGLLQG